jgi:hypothetical protein
MMIGGGISYVAQGAGYVATALEAFWAQVPIVGCAAVTSIGLSYFLIPRLGLPGGAYAFGAASAVQFLGTAAVAVQAIRKAPGVPDPITTAVAAGVEQEC